MLSRVKMISYYTDALHAPCTDSVAPSCGNCWLLQRTCSVRCTAATVGVTVSITKQLQWSLLQCLQPLLHCALRLVNLHTSRCWHNDYNVTHGHRVIWHKPPDRPWVELLSLPTPSVCKAQLLLLHWEMILLEFWNKTSSQWPACWEVPKYNKCRSCLSCIPTIDKTANAITLFISNFIKLHKIIKWNKAR